MFTTDESPSHVDASPTAQAHLVALAAARGDITVMLTEHGAAVLRAGQQPPAGSILLGSLDEAGDISCVADESAAHTWWRTRAHLDLSGPEVSDSIEMSYDVAQLSEAELFAALAAGPLRRY